MNPEFPLYIVSKGRYDSRFTSKSLEAMKVPYSIVVEEQEYAQYCAVIDKSKIIVLDKAYQRDYDAFASLGPTESKGSGPARNFVWDHSISRGAPYHWIVDDNIKEFYRLANNDKIRVSDGTIFKCMEDFAQRYLNVGMAGPNYKFLAKRKQKIPPFVANTRIYSCILICNDAPFRWRGRYNEDTDLSIRMLKAGWCTILFNAFLQGKMTTMTMKGGNTDELYAKGTEAKSKMIVAMHPDVCRLTMRFRRIHHYADYSKFSHLRLVKKEGVEIQDKIDNYGMRVVKVRTDS